MDLDEQGDADHDRRARVADEAVRRLMGHFDTVVVLATYYDGAGQETREVVSGMGNWHARYGQMVAYIKKLDVMDEVATRRNAEPED